jgi:hypothetical protein
VVRSAVLVGLLGLASSTIAVRGVTAASNASTSVAHAVSGASTTVAPASSVNWG